MCSHNGPQPRGVRVHAVHTFWRWDRIFTSLRPDSPGTPRGPHTRRGLLQMVPAVCCSHYTTNVAWIAQGFLVNKVH